VDSGLGVWEWVGLEIAMGMKWDERGGMEIG
jgi:hypothetical protein